MRECIHKVLENLGRDWQRSELLWLGVGLFQRALLW
jgi:hypothetical protein